MAPWSRLCSLQLHWQLQSPALLVRALRGDTGSWTECFGCVPPATGQLTQPAKIKVQSEASFLSVLGGLGNPPSPASRMVSGLPIGFGGFAVMPKPITVTLGAIEISALFIRLRK